MFLSQLDDTKCYKTNLCLVKAPCKTKAVWQTHWFLADDNNVLIGGILALCNTKCNQIWNGIHLLLYNYCGNKIEDSNENSYLSWLIFPHVEPTSLTVIKRLSRSLVLVLQNCPQKTLFCGYIDRIYCFFQFECKRCMTWTIYTLQTIYSLA